MNKILHWEYDKKNKWIAIGKSYNYEIVKYECKDEIYKYRISFIIKKSNRIYWERQAPYLYVCKNIASIIELENI